jgi:predicted MFS family arabinose efflux permease
MATGAGVEWRRYWPVVLAAALGHSTTTLPVYSIGAFVVPLQQAFGWTRAEIALGSTVSASVGWIFTLSVGLLIDRWGPRRVGLSGIVIMCSAYALLSTVSGNIISWYLHWLLLGFSAAWIQPTIWSGAVATRFDASRGLAIALTVSGAGIGAAVLPPLATFLIAEFGWRGGFIGIPAIWAAVALPIIFLFFRGAQDTKKVQARNERQNAGDALPGLSLAQGLRSPVLYKMAVAGMLFHFSAVGLMTQFVPVLESLSVERMTAAEIAGLIGVTSIAGRLVTGMLLDRFRADRVAMGALFLPAFAAALILNSHSAASLSFAAMFLGLSLGSEFDCLMYLATRHLGLRRFGMMFAVMLVFLSLGAATGPLAAGAIFDHTGSYRLYVWLLFPVVTVASLLIGFLGPYPEHIENFTETATAH